jgi:hypothetical protein
MVRGWTRAISAASVRVIKSAGSLLGGLGIGDSRSAQNPEYDKSVLGQSLLGAFAVLPVR